MKKIYGYIAAAAVAGSLVLSTVSLSEAKNNSDELALIQAKALAVAEASNGHLTRSLERIRAVESSVVKHSRPSALERSSAGRIHWFMLED